MAGEQEVTSNKVGTANTFEGGMYKDSIDLIKKSSTYNHARNAATNLPDGQLGALSTEPANLECVTLPYTLIGAISLADDIWALFMTDNTVWEIGYFYDDQCRYQTITGPQHCPIFHKNHLVIGAARRGFDCGFDIYWSTGGYSYDGFLNTAKVPWVQNCTTNAGCITCIDTTVIDCEKLRLAPHFIIPCLKLAKSEGGGQLPNGSYQVAIRYAVNSQPCTDFIALSPIESVFAHNNLASAIKLTIFGAETTIFQQMEVVVVSSINRQVQARSLGIYSTSQSVIYIDDLDQELRIIPLELLPLNTPAIESSDAIYAISPYLTRVGPRTKPEFNYQPLANLIIAKWACVEYNDQYYHRGGDQFGMNTSYLRDEVYAFYIRWIWDSGDKTVSYVIPGLPAGTPATFAFGGPSSNDTGTTIASGRFAGYSSTELYPDRTPDVWGFLCGQPVMHHRFPDQTLHPALTHFTNNFTIRVMGVFFENIKLPVDNNGNIIQDIQGYEILRASRDGHRSIVAKGMVNHMRGYLKVDGTQGIYQNYPYDDLSPDFFLTQDQVVGSVGGTVVGNGPSDMNIVYSNKISFHSPDTTFSRPNLGGSGSLVLYQALSGYSTGEFVIPWNHPKFKLLTDQATRVSIIITSIYAISEAINILSGQGTQLNIASTDDLPMNLPLGISAIAEGPAGSVSTAIYAAGVAAAITASFIMGAMQLRVLQEQILHVIQGLVPAIQTALQYNSHGFYDTPVQVAKSTLTVNDYQYIEGHLSTFDVYDVNNLFRNGYLLLALNSNIPTLPQPLLDRSRFTMGQAQQGPYKGPWKGHPNYPNIPNLASWYGAYKIPQPSQYGQYDSGKQLPISCVQVVNTALPTSIYTSALLFGGDTYINRYTEKNSFFYFNDWLMNNIEDFQFNYTNYHNLPYARFWVNNSKVYFDDWGATAIRPGASKFWHLDELDQGTVIFGVGLSLYVKNGFFYLFNSGIRDFYVESEVNVGYRDWEDEPSKRFYDPYGYTSLDYMFRSDIIKSDVYYKYDYSLSASLFYNQYFSWGKTVDRDYDPALAYTCFSYYPRRIIYSLPQFEENKKDNWRIFLPNNYIDLDDRVSAIKSIGNNGAIILMENSSPALLPGVQTIPSSSGTDYTVGNGNLFSQNLTYLSNSEGSLQYGSTQNRLSIINTPHGIFWVSRDTGKVFVYNGSGGVQDITSGVKWHLARYMPSQLLKLFPSYPFPDNPVTGIGIQCTYDNVNEVLYICKKDYAVKSGVVLRDGGDGYIYQDISEGVELVVTIGDPLYFEDASWTLSYDCKRKQWISWHDWFPALNILSKNHFLTTTSSYGFDGRTLWRHNLRTDYFCNYYGLDFPWEVQYQASTAVTETTLKNIEVILEAYRYRPNSTDRFQVFATFFDRAIISNPEQNSDMLKLVLQPWNDPYAQLQYPFFDSVGSNILYTKTENKFRLNSFYDYTNDRFQFGIGVTQAINTDESGYKFLLNNAYFNRLKSPLQLKRFRYRGTNVFLRKLKVQEVAMELMTATSNNQLSYR